MSYLDRLWSKEEIETISFQKCTSANCFTCTQDTSLQKLTLFIIVLLHNLKCCIFLFFPHARLGGREKLLVYEQRAKELKEPRTTTRQYLCFWHFFPAPESASWAPLQLTLHSQVHTWCSPHQHYQAAGTSSRTSHGGAPPCVTCHPCAPPL